MYVCTGTGASEFWEASPEASARDADEDLGEADAGQVNIGPSIATEDDPDSDSAGTGRGDGRQKRPLVDMGKGVTPPLPRVDQPVESKSRIQSTSPSLEPEPGAVPAKGGLAVPSPVSKPDSAESLVFESEAPGNTGCQVDIAVQQLAEDVSNPCNDLREEVAPAANTVVPESPSLDASAAHHDSRATLNPSQAGETLQPANASEWFCLIQSAPD